MSNREFYQALETLVRANASAELARLAGLGRVLLDCATEADAAELLDDWTGRLLLAQALPGWGWGHAFRTTDQIDEG